MFPPPTKVNPTYQLAVIYEFSATVQLHIDIEYHAHDDCDITADLSNTVNVS